MAPPARCRRESAATGSETMTRHDSGVDSRGLSFRAGGPGAKRYFRRGRAHGEPDDLAGEGAADRHFRNDRRADGCRNGASRPARLTLQRFAAASRKSPCSSCYGSRMRRPACCRRSNGKNRESRTSKLTLTFRDQTVVVNEARKSINMGRADDNDLVIKGNLISRIHARIEQRRGRFILIDQSTNGTFLQTCRVRRRSYGGTA